MESLLLNTSNHLIFLWKRLGSQGRQKAVVVPKRLKLKIGRDERIRTSDPHTPSVMRYQAALRPDRFRCGQMHRSEERAYRQRRGAWQAAERKIAAGA